MLGKFFVPNSGISPKPMRPVKHIFLKKQKKFESKKNNTGYQYPFILGFNKVMNINIGDGKQFEMELHLIFVSMDFDLLEKMVLMVFQFQSQIRMIEMTMGKVL